MLHEAGARPHNAPLAWVENHLQWICWKLAALEAQHSHLQAQILTADVVLDELKIRWDLVRYSVHAPVASRPMLTATRSYQRMHAMAPKKHPTCLCFQEGPWQIITATS